METHNAPFAPSRRWVLLSAVHPEVGGANCHRFCRKAAQVIKEIYQELNNRPVYTVSQVLTGANFQPQKLIGMGGPAVYFIPKIGHPVGLPTRFFLPRGRQRHSALLPAGPPSPLPYAPIRLWANCGAGVRLRGDD